MWPGRSDTTAELYDHTGQKRHNLVFDPFSFCIHIFNGRWKRGLCSVFLTFFIVGVIVKLYLLTFFLFPLWHWRAVAGSSRRLRKNGWISGWSCTSPLCVRACTLLGNCLMMAEDSCEGWGRLSDSAHLLARWPSSLLWCRWAGSLSGGWHGAPGMVTGMPWGPRRCSCVWRAWLRCSPRGTHGWERKM